MKEKMNNTEIERISGKIPIHPIIIVGPLVLIYLLSIGILFIFPHFISISFVLIFSISIIIGGIIFLDSWTENKKYYIIIGKYIIIDNKYSDQFAQDFNN